MAKILVVEDDASLRTVIRLVLEQAGHEIAEAPNGRVGLELVGHAAPDLLVVDAKMPLVSGAELIERLRSQPAHAAIPVVLLTGLPGDVPAGLRADAVVAKPFEWKDLVSVVGGLLRTAP